MYAQIYDLKEPSPLDLVCEAACPPEVLATATQIAHAAGVRCLIEDGRHLHVFAESSDGMQVAHFAVAEVMVRILNELIEADVLQEENMREPEECLWPIETVAVVGAALKITKA